jgi:thioredoxin 1
MATVDFDMEKLKTTLEQQEGIVLLDFWADWCAPCKQFAPIYEKVSEDHPDITFGKVDTQAQPQLAQAFSIRSIPTLMVFRDGILLFNQPGMLPEEGLQDVIKQVRELDMDEVRQKVADAGAEQQEQS